MTKVINLFAGPGAGKSTTAAGLFFEMKQRGLSVELVTEYAKELTWDEHHPKLGNQLALLGEQFHRLWRLRGKVDWIITDSPLPLGWVYAQESDVFDRVWMEQAIFHAFALFHNRNFVIQRRKAYVAAGRNQTEDEAIALDRAIREVLDLHAIPATRIPGDRFAVSRILKELNLG